MKTGTCSRNRELKKEEEWRQDELERRNRNLRCEGMKEKKT